MGQYSFQDTLAFFSEKLNATPSEEDLEEKSVDLMIDEVRVRISEASLEGSLYMEIVLGLMLQPIIEPKLKELASSNFLGVNTGGCTFAFDEAGVALSLHCHTTPGATPQEHWEWLHRIVCVAREWNKVLSLWDIFVPLTSPKEEKAR